MGTQVAWTSSIERGEHEIDVEVLADVIAGRAGFGSGPPEMCSPPEPGDCELIRVDWEGVDIQDFLTEEECDRLRCEANDALRSKVEDDYDS